MKKFIALLMVSAILSIAVTTFAASKSVTCPTCHGKRWVPCQSYIAVFNWKRNDKGKKVRVPPYTKPCPHCHATGKKRCTNCGGTGKKVIFY